MGLKQVKDDIIEEAKNKADSIVKEAEQEKEEIISDAETEAEKIEESAEEDLEQEKSSLERRRLSNARMKAKKEKLEAKQDKIDEAFREFRSRIKNLDGSERNQFVSSCIDHVEFEIGDIKASEKFQDAVDSEGYDYTELEDGEGIILFSVDGEKSQNFTVDKIVANYRQNYRKDAAEVLFQ